MKPVWNNRHIHWKTKIRLFNSNVKTVLLYGAETWRRTKRLDQSLQVFINKCLRQILRIRWPEKISNQDLWARTGQQPVTDSILQKKWIWIGHATKSPAQHSKASPGLGSSRSKKRKAYKTPGVEPWTLSFVRHGCRGAKQKPGPWIEPDGVLW